MRDFPTPVIISAATGKLVCPFDQLHELLQYASGEPIWTHQLGRVSKEFSASILWQHPTLSKAFDEAKNVTPENYKDFSRKWLADYGDALPVAVMSHDDHERIDPMSELAEKVHPDKIISISI